MSSPGDAPGADAAPNEVDAIATKLRELAARLRDPDLAEGEAEQLAREAADLVGRAGNEIDRMLRAIGDESEP